MRQSAIAWWLFLAYAAFIIYGSLVPLDYRALPFDQAWDRFVHAPFLQLGLASRADWVANGVLYVPLGFLAVRMFGAAGAFAFLPALPLCFGLAFAVEFTQVYFPPRTVSQNDLIAECLGSLLGATLVPFFGPWLARLRAAWTIDGTRLVHYALQTYVAGYVLFCFFPFDFLLSPQELRGKLASDHWGWLLAFPEGRPGMRIGLQWLVELALSVPIGMLLVRGKPEGAGLAHALLVGAMLGLFIELGQLFVASGLSQGASVISRGLGVGLGAWLQRDLAAVGIQVWRRRLAGAALWLLPPYLLLLCTASGWWSHAWTASPAAAWAEMRLMPFYYHYFTSEAQAVYSLGGVVVMYLPLAALGWAGHRSAAATAWWAAIAALIIEGGKLFQIDAHPDPTNVLIAAASNWLLIQVLASIESRTPVRVPASVTSARPVASVPPVRSAPPPPTAAGPPAACASPDRRSAAHAPSARHAHWWRLLLLPLAAGAAWTLPAVGPLAFAVIALCVVVVWWRPLLLLAIVPAALPVFDLAPWSGRYFIDEFDLLQAACLAVGFYRVPAPGTRRRVWPASTWVFLLFGASLLISTWRGLWPLPDFDANSLASYYSHFNALRIAKGALWALLFLRLYERLAQTQPDAAATSFSAGINAGLALTIAVILWERAAFVGWFNFAGDYRITGPFSAMHKGGAYIECFLAVASAYTMALLVRPRRRWLIPFALTLLTATTYAIMVTYSRNGYAAFGLVLAIGLLAAVATAINRPLRLIATLGAVALIGAVALPILNGPYARERLGQVRQDFEIRAAHWSDALNLRTDDALTEVFGMGVGRFPDAHFWRSQEPQRAAGFRLERENDNLFLRLGAGATIYIEQIVGAAAAGPLTLSADIRSSTVPARLNVYLCRKWMLASRDCRQVTLEARAGAGSWQTVQAALPPAIEAAFIRAPFKLTLATPGTGALLDVDNLRLYAAGDAGLLHNGDFHAGMDRWFFATDIDPPWHIHNLAVSVLFDQGWFGVLAWLALLAVALGGGWRAARRGSAAGLAALAGLGAFLVSGSLNTLIDAPRFLWLFLVLAALAAGTHETRSRRAMPDAASGMGRRSKPHGPQRSP